MMILFAFLLSVVLHSDDILSKTALGATAALFAAVLGATTARLLNGATVAPDSIKHGNYAALH